MSTYWFRAEYSIMLDDPGYGTLEIDHEGTEWHVRLAGEQLGRFLAAITACALGTAVGDEGRSLLPWFLTAADARELLPALQQAAIAAAAGSDKLERLYPDAGAPPQGPICVRCGAGFFTYPETGIFCGACLRLGHKPFGTDASWERAQQTYEAERTYWRHRHPTP
ncbi:hypothetical protein KZX45_08315 [Georgenia sp. EYE_87]|uniref:hypothetical protein n=1 Tax=Georgenia sp. EYE_87 TaxID=2853448 RepID=UPI0020043EA6|nr:hypothetical protein [Georgenia sp. EYE_87]MCK6210545.1 hypothetical protein [Georgenia sp. EYE_87]